MFVVNNVWVVVAAASFHKNEAPAPASNVTVPPHWVTSEPILTVGTLLIVTFAVFEVPEQPFASVTTTEYAPEFETTNVWEVVAAKSFHKYEAPIPASKVNVPPHCVLPVPIFTTGTGLIITEIVLLVVVPQLLVTVTK